MVKLVPHARVQQRTVEHEPVPQVLEETVEVALVPQERVQQRTVDHVPVPQFLEETVEVALVSHGRMQQRAVEQSCGCTSISGGVRRGGEVSPTRTRAATNQRANYHVAIPQITEQFVEVGLAPQARVQWTVKQILELPIPQIMELW